MNENDKKFDQIYRSSEYIYNKKILENSHDVHNEQIITTLVAICKYKTNQQKIACHGSPLLT